MANAGFNPAFSNLFQFQYGTIKGHFSIKAFPKIIIRFNSSMVRLRAHIHHLSRLQNPRFNSSMVRLRDNHGQRNNIFKFVSIPVWYD